MLELRLDSSGQALAAQFGKFWAQKCVLRADVYGSLGLEQTAIVLGTAAQVLVQQHVAVVRAIDQVVYNHKVLAMGAKGLFPAAVQSIVVYHQPINALVAQCLTGLLCVCLPVST